MSLPKKKKRSQIDLMNEIIKLLSKNKELSISRISYKLNSPYRSVLPALNFLKDHNLLKERRIKIRNTENRLFSLNKTN